MGELAVSAKAICSDIGSALASLGFVRKGRGGGILVSEIEGGVYRWVGIPQSIYRSSGIVSTNLNIGAHHRPLEALIDQLFKRENAGDWHATVAWPIGYFMPQKQYSPWDLRVTDDRAAAVREMNYAIRTYGMPWMTQLNDLDKLSSAIRRYSV